jgi:dihydrofolate reductase
MRLVRFGGAMSLDGYIAGPNGEYDWIVMDPDIDFAAMQARVDTYLIGRKTFEAMGRKASGRSRGIRTIVASRTIEARDYPRLTVTADAARTVVELKAQPGKDIAIFGGGDLFRSLLADGLVDRVEVAVIPVLLGGGIPLLPAPAARAVLALRSHRVYETTGTIGLEYDVVRR